jgi:hypothetical protein
MTRYAKRVDANHAEIRDALRAAGYDVIDISKCGNGVPDLSVQVAPFLAVMLEVKDGAKAKSAQKLTEAEKQWLGHWGHVTRVVNSLEAAKNAISEFTQKGHHERVRK